MNLFVNTSGNGPDLVMLHGWGLHGGIFQRIADALVHRYRIHRVDLPGHGASPTVIHFDLQAIVDWLAVKFPDPVHVLGWSLGGAVGQYWAYAYPMKVQSLSLVASSPSFVARPNWPHAQSPEAIETMGHNLYACFNGTLERFLALQMLGVPNAREMLKVVHTSLSAYGCPQGLIPALNLLLKMDNRPIINKIKCPTAIFHGTRDAITPIGAGHWLASQLSCATWYEFPRASHMPFISDETVFLKQLTHHLSQNL